MGTLPPFVVLLHNIAGLLAAREAGINVLALVSISAAMALGQYLRGL